MTRAHLGLGKSGLLTSDRASTPDRQPLTPDPQTLTPNPQPPTPNTTVETIIHARRSVRAYRPEPVPEADLAAILEAARWAPSPHNAEPWRFIVLRGLAAKQRLARAMGQRWREDLEHDGVARSAIESALQRSLERITNPPVVIVVCLCQEGLDTYPDARRQQAEVLMAAHSVGAAVQNMMLVARERGLATGWMCAPLFCPEAVVRALGLPGEYVAQGLVMVGHPAGWPEARDRRPLADLVTAVD